MQMKSPSEATILIVDDSPTNLGILFEMLSRCHYRILVAESGESALRVVSKTRVDLILLDVMMPGMSGFETCRRLREDPRSASISVVFVSALDDVETKDTAARCGGRDFLSKPLLRQTTLDCVRRNLEPTADNDGAEPAGVPDPEPARGDAALDSTVRHAVDPSLLSWALHDLRSALGGALGFAEALGEGTEGRMDCEDSGELNDWLVRSLLSMEETLHTLSLTRNLRDHASNPSDCPLEELIGEAAKRVGERLNHKPVRVLWASASGNARCDRTLLAEFFYLLICALVSLADENCGLVVRASVEDNGTLVLEADGRPLLKEEKNAFFRLVDDSAESRVGNVGFTLAGIQMLAERLELRGRVESTVDANQFIVGFPHPLS